MGEEVTRLSLIVDDLRTTVQKQGDIIQQLEDTVENLNDEVKELRSVKRTGRKKPFRRLSESSEEDIRDRLQRLLRENSSSESDNT